MKKLKLIGHLLLAVFMLFTSRNLQATNIQVSDIVIVERNDAEEYIVVQFNLSWDYSFRVEDGDNTNWDAAWVFLKYKRTDQSNVQWGHATLHGSGHHIPGNFTSSLGETGGVNKGIFVYPSVIFSNTATINGMRLRWNYGENGLLPEHEVDIRVFGIEMVHVPQGSFYVGSGGGEANRFHAAQETNTTPFQVTDAPFSVSNTAGNLWATGARVAGDLAAGYPTGYNSFYMMKHSITQQAYVDFLNTLSYAQQDARIDGSPDAASGTFTNNANRHKIKIATSGVAGTSPAVYETENPWVPANFIAPADLLSYLDWAALRPFTELEYEKAARGPASPLALEYAWGNTRLGQVTEITNAGLATETVVSSGFQRDITIDHTKVNETLTDFPILVKLDIDNFNFDNCRPNGWDLRFYDAGGNLLSYQRERHDFTAKRAEYWVKVPSISSSQNTIITLEYGNLTAPDGADPANVWDNDYVSVWHLNENGDGTAGEFIDSKGSNNGQGEGTIPSRVEGQVGLAQEFDGEAAISVPHAAALDIETAITLSGWVKPQALTNITLSESVAADWNSNYSMSNLTVSSDNLIVSDYTSRGTRILSPVSLDAIKRAGATNISWEYEPGYTVQAFEDDGTFIVPAGVTEVDVLVVAGGGGGGGTIGGGGGAGGLVYESGYTVTPGSSMTVRVGDGGLGGIGYNNPGQAGQQGGNSVFGTITAIGGGGGAGWIGHPPTDGGSGGGSANSVPPGSGTPDQGFNGGQSNANRGGGGGGASEVGENGGAGTGGNGGDGLYYGNLFGDIFGDSGWFAGGGGGGVRTGNGPASVGGQGGGGTGTTTSVKADDGLPGTGGGGGGAGYVGTNTDRIGGNGGSGVVLIRYRDPNTAKVYTSISDSNTEGFPGVEIFTSDGTFTVPAGITEVEVIVVAGGGAGGDHSTQTTQTAAGGGGGGGVIYESSYSVTPGGNISVTVGTGGSVVANNRGGKGGNSVFGTITAEGGGGGGFRDNGNGVNGGSGGGAGYQGAPGSGTVDQGNDGGDDYDAVPYYGGGGGGAGTTGSDANVNSGGNGGNGFPLTISGQLQYFGGGGGGGAGRDATAGSYGLGGTGGGGRGGHSETVNAVDGAPNTGGGGGGAGSEGSTAGAGGSGIVIVRWGQEAANNNPIPGIGEGDDLSGKYLWVMQELNSNNPASSPEFESLELEINGQAIIAGKGEGTYHISYSDGNLRGFINDQVVTTPITADEYQHVAVTYNGSFQRLFVNGTLRNTTALSGSIVTNTDALYLGANLQGELDEIRLSSASRSQAWINAEYHSGLNDLIHIGTEGTFNNAVTGNVDWQGGIGQGPIRVGFAASPTSSRTASGASYWGIMELSGNLWEWNYTAGQDYGRAFTGLHGDGQVSAAGLFDVTNWPGEMGIRGGAFLLTGGASTARLRISDRNNMNWDAAWTTRSAGFGGRGVRTAP
jgi:formylglycine-generating enzyme required for sulfatase activity